jgi:hypothetical protein
VSLGVGFPKKWVGPVVRSGISQDRVAVRRRFGRCAWPGVLRQINERNLDGLLAGLQISAEYTARVREACSKDCCMCGIFLVRKQQSWTDEPLRPGRKENQIPISTSDTCHLQTCCPETRDAFAAFKVCMYRSRWSRLYQDAYGVPTLRTFYLGHPKISCPFPLRRAVPLEDRQDDESRITAEH